MSKREAYWVHDDKGGYWQIPVEGEAYNFRTPPGFVMHPAGEAVTDSDILWDMRHIDDHLKYSEDAAPILIQGVRRVLRRVMRPPVEAHCATCSCVPGMTPAVRFDATAAEKEGAVREQLIRMGWTPPAEAQDIGPEWKPCRKRPVIVHVREQRPDEQHVSTREGITPVMRDDLIIRGVEGEEYPIGRELFAKTYDMVPDAPPSAPVGVEAKAIAYPVNEGRCDNQRQPQGTTSGGSPDYSRRPSTSAPDSGVEAIRQARAIIDHVIHGEPGYELSAAHGLLTAALAQQPAAGIFKRIRQTPEYAREMDKLASALGYQNAFHEVAAMLDIPAQPLSPKEVWETQMRPKLLALTSQQPAAVDGPYRTVDGVVTVNGIALDEAVKVGDRYAATIEKRGMPRAAQVFEALVMIGRHALAAQQGDSDNG